MRLQKIHLILPLAIAFALAGSTALAQDAGDDPIIQDASVPRSKLVERYTDLAGSPEAAGSLVDNLREGGDFVVVEEVTTENPDGTTSTTTVERTIANPNGPMGWGEVNISLSLAGALIDSGNAPDLQSALTGIETTVVQDDGSSVTTVEGGVLAMRADHMGWGQIANELGFKLGALVSAGNRSEHAAARASTRVERGGGKPERVARAERPERPVRPERAERPERPEKPERPQRPERPERGGR